MNYSKKAIDLIKKWEGYHEKLADGRARAYRCPANVLTIGYGSTFYTDGSTIKAGDIISHDRAIELLEHEMKDCGDAVNRHVAVSINQNIFDALVSFVYNLGEGNFKNSTLLRKLNSGDAMGAADELLRWNKAKVGGVLVPLAGLTNRRLEERELFLTGSSEIPIYFETIKKGDRGEAVRKLQKILVSLAYFPKDEVIDGIFGYNTQSKVMLFQKTNALIEDGIVGKNTWEALHKKLGDLGNHEQLDNWSGINDNYIVIRKTNKKHASGLQLLDVSFFEKGVAYGHVTAYSGQPYAQNFRKGNESRAGSMEPPTETRKGYKVHDIDWAGGKDDWLAEHSSALGPWLVWMQEKDPADTNRREICFHQDWNKSYAIGSAGCISFETIEEGKRFLKLLRQADPKHCFVDWGLNYVEKKI